MTEILHQYESTGGTSIYDPARYDDEYDDTYDDAYDAAGDSEPEEPRFVQQNQISKSINQKSRSIKYRSEA